MLCHSVLITHFIEVLDVLFSYKLIKKNDVLPAFKIWIPGGMNDVNYDTDRSKDIHTRFQADTYMDKRHIAFRVLGENFFFLKKRSRLEHVNFY